ncbi:MAG: hypothetical protein KDJ27_11305 [Gammaproteobacteria bacterium]|nr:hypothetical protein [Gammaproteobacteria bacterium]
MSLGDPFGRVARRRQTAYHALRAQLQQNDVQTTADVERLVARLSRTTGRLVLLLVAVVAVISLAVPQWQAAVILAGCLIGLWIGTSFLQTRSQLRSYHDEIVRREKRLDEDRKQTPIEESEQ